MSATEKLAQLLQPLGDAALREGEELRGVCAATEVKTFSGGTRAVIVTDRRILVQPVDRYWRAKGEVRSISPGDVTSAKVSGLADGWWNTPISLADDAGHTVKLRLVDGSKLKLMLMAARGKMLGPLSGGEYQRSGAQALIAWLGGLDQIREHAG